MKPLSTSNFGLLIAYVVPGFTALWGGSYFSQTLRAWLGGASADGPTLGGFLYVTVASVVCGLTVSTVRWAVIDPLLHRTGIPRPQWDFSRLQRHIDAYDALTENHYRYYQFYSGMVVALLAVLFARWLARGTGALGWSDAGLLVLAAIFFAGARDTFRKYYLRLDQLLRSQAD